jgi:hypothetical protein
VQLLKHVFAEELLCLKLCESEHFYEFCGRKPLYSVNARSVFLRDIVTPYPKLG